MDGYFHQDIHPEDVVAWPTNIGWMMGPWLVFATLINGATMALYQGIPTGDGFRRFVRDARVTVLGVVPSLVRAWRSSGAQHDWECVRLFSSTGEPSDRRDYLWLMSCAGYGAPVIEYCGGTEIGGGYITGTVVQPSSPSLFTTPALGLDLVILDKAGKPVAEGEAGEAYLVPPSLGLSQELLNEDHDQVYYHACPQGPSGEVLRRHGDRLTRLAKGFYKAQGRSDDTMNLGGIKVSALELEQVLDTHEAVYESAAVAVQPEGEGAEKLVVYVVLEQKIEEGQLSRELGVLLARSLNPLFKIHDLVLAEELPRTASNKLMRRKLRSSYRGGRGLDGP
jgi:acetyl-CoA synthetase